jgi:hypothetical protein
MPYRFFIFRLYAITVIKKMMSVLRRNVGVRAMASITPTLNEIWISRSKKVGVMLALALAPTE